MAFPDAIPGCDALILREHVTGHSLCCFLLFPFSEVSFSQARREESLLDTGLNDLWSLHGHSFMTQASFKLEVSIPKIPMASDCGDVLRSQNKL